MHAPLLPPQIIKNIERGEQKIQRQADILDAIAGKLAKYKNPWNELKVGWGLALIPV
jgi:SWI/SNF-related matrix-associated actin-dependent regulator of chromatin subfamily A member 5